MLKPRMSSITDIVTIPYGQCTVTVKANGGTVDIDVLHDDATLTWVPATDQIIADGATTLFLSQYSRLRISPGGGATWTIHGPGF